MNETKKKPDKRSIGARKILGLFANWGVAIFGTVGVALLLMYLAGAFNEKVSEVAGESVRSIPAGAKIVEVKTIVRPRYETAVGSIEPIHESSVASKLLAKVVEVNVTAGQRVERGDILVRLNDDDLRSRLQQAQAQRAAAEAHAQQAQLSFKRAEQLVQQNAISRAEYDLAATAVRTSQAELDRATQAIEEAKVVLDYTIIKAPFKGVVIDKNVEPGDTVTPGQTLLTLYDPESMQLVANVRESLATKLKVGEPLRARLDTFDHECLATVPEVVPRADVGSRSFQVKVSGPCPPGVYSGMFGRIMLPLADEKLIVVPRAAVRHVGQLRLVDVVEGEHTVRRSIQVGRKIDDLWEVLSGLKPGEKIVLTEDGGSD